MAVKRLLIPFFLLSFISLFMLSYASSWRETTGNSARDDDIRAMFENYKFVSNYGYFYTDHGNGPVAIVGIKKDYELVKVSGRGNVTNWQQFEPGDDKLKELVDTIKADRGPERKGLNDGYIISTPGGDQVGVMYAKRLPETYTQIGFRGGSIIAVSPHILRQRGP